MGDVMFWIGKVLFSAIFILSGFNHFMQLASMSQYAESKGVPAARLMVPLTGLAIVLGGASILLWGVIPSVWVAVGCWLLIIFLVLAGIKMHDFWAIEDPMEQQVQMAHFMKNMALAGAALIFYVITAFEYVPPMGGP